MSQQTINTVNATKLDWQVFAGVLWEIQMEIVDQNNAPVTVNTPVRMEVRKNFQSPVEMVFTDGDGLTVSGNLITFSKIIDIKGGTYEYDLVEVHSDASLRPFFFGDFIVIQNITLPRG